MAYQYDDRGWNKNSREQNKNSYGRNNDSYGRTQYTDKAEEAKSKANTYFAKKTFLKSWIETGADAALPEYAEHIGKSMADERLTSSKFRSVYGEIKRIQMGNFEKEKAAFYLLRPKMAYAVGRDKENAGLQLLKKVFDVAADCVKDGRTFINFANFMEAVLAYHKAYIKKDN